jgi:hypothetical protein
MRKLKLKEDEDGNKISEVKGIRAACKVMKTRYSKPFESVQVKIPYETGMSPYSGLVDLAEGKGVLKKTGNRLEYIDKETGEAITQFRKAWERNENNCLDLIMKQWDDHEVDDVVEDIEVDELNIDEVTSEETTTHETE